MSEQPLATALRKGIPGARNVDHFAFTVPDLAQAVEFFSSVLGGELIYQIGPVEDPDGDWMAVHLGVHPRASTHIAMMRLGPVTNLELFEYQAPEQNRELPLNSDLGGHHLGIWVEDVDAAVEYLRAQPGVEFNGEPLTMPSGPNEGDRFVYFRTPWGMQLEVHSTPRSMPYEKETEARRFGPLPAWSNRDVAGVEGVHDRGIPGARHVDHAAYTVPDLDAAVAFFTDVLGAEVVYRLGPTELDADFMRRYLNVPAAGTIQQVLLRMGPRDNIELFHYDVPGSRTELPANSDVGGHHLAFYVEDVDAAVEYLRAQPGVEIMGEPETIEDGPIAGDRWVYFRAPWGMSLEVLNMPDGEMPYERDTAARRAQAAPRWDNRAV